MIALDHIQMNAAKLFKWDTINHSIFCEKIIMWQIMKMNLAVRQKLLVVAISLDLRKALMKIYNSLIQ